jgi:uncharacterized membrane-anchored protein
MESSEVRLIISEMTPAGERDRTGPLEAGRGALYLVDGVLGLFILAVLANVAFSVVYVADVFIQSSRFRSSRRVWRWAFLLVGFAFAAVLTHVMSGNMFVPPQAG